MDRITIRLKLGAVHGFDKNLGARGVELKFLVKKRAIFLLIAHNADSVVNVVFFAFALSLGLPSFIAA